MRTQRRQDARDRISRAARMLGICALAAGAQCALALEKLSYNMAWLPQGSSVGVIVAQDRKSVV